MAQVKLRSYEMLEEENKELKMMMRKLCHEMGNALTVLGGSIFYMEHEPRLKEVVNEIINVKNDYAYICKLFNNLRDYNHTEAIDKTNVTLTDMVDNIESVFDKLNTESDVQLQMEKTIDTDSISVYADMTKLRQAIINIMKNSIEAMEENNKEKSKNIIVRVSTEMVPHQGYGESLEDVKGKEVVHIELRDNGKGIPEKNINDIFQPLYTYGKQEGSGLGLAVVKKIIEDHRGKIKAVSAVGTGTAMHIYLPVSKICAS